MTSINLKSLPLELENIIKDYYYQLEHVEKFKPVFNEIRQYGYIKDFLEERNIKLTLNRINLFDCEVFLKSIIE